ncbi:uncharacterized protein LOC132192436 [Neocloeon triangulifer]|uniref:uncharacterized protein LOC132192436 n=1 Tax=Neocloeon triangulifer TaxID=2078957 RepID=UPI00286F7C5D|nr:uncharacterized protein LOC132192436 [Neocloeon triangulifer]
MNNRGYYVPCAPFLYFVPDSGGTTQPALAGASAALEVRPAQPPSTGGAAPTAAPVPSTPLSAAPFQYLIHEQAKSLVALQELQNEVGALLEFRELVIETFPHLRSKISSASSTMGSEVNLPEASTSSAPATPSTTAVGPGWGPGVRVRRRIPKERNSPTAEDSSAEMTKLPKGPKSSEGASCSTVQDSGFSTETKEHHSSGASVKASSGGSGGGNSDASMDELWNLLDVIQRKGSRLRDEVHDLQTKLQHEAVRGGGGEGTAAADWSPPPGVRSWGEEDDPSEMRRLRMERDVLLDKVTEMEAETLQSRARVSQLQAELRQISSIRRGLEDQLLLSARNSCVCSMSSTSPRRIKLESPRASSQVRERSSGFQPVRSSSGPSPRHVRRRSRLDSASSPLDFDSRIPRYVHRPSTGGRTPSPATPGRPPLGALDCVIGDPQQVTLNLPPSFKPSPHKVAAILGERNPLELQRHLLTSVVHNEALQIELERASLRKNEINGELERMKEENDELKFQLEERSIELEGTRARVRVLERHNLSKSPSVGHHDPKRHHFAGTDDPILLAMTNTSSTESAHDLTLASNQPPEPPKRQNNKQSTNNKVTNSMVNNNNNKSRIPLQTGTTPPKGSPEKKKTSAGSLGRASLKKVVGVGGASLKSSRESLASSTLMSRSKDSLNKLSSLPRKNSSLPRPNNSPSHKGGKSTPLDTATKEAASSSSLGSVPLVEVALCPADSLNTAHCRRRGEEMVPWQGASMAFSYFDSINSEQLWQRHSTDTNGDSLEQY